MRTPRPSRSAAAPEHDERYARLAADIAARLREPCAHLDPASFASLVHDLTVRKIEWLTRYPGEVTRLPPHMVRSIAGNTD